MYETFIAVSVLLGFPLLTAHRGCRPHTLRVVTGLRERVTSRGLRGDTAGEP